MSITHKADLQDKILRRLGNITSDKLNPEAVLPDMVDAAIEHYSRYHPRVKVYEESGDGDTVRFVLPDTITTWSNGSDRVQAVYAVQDAGLNDEYAAAYDPEDWWVERDTADDDVLFLAHAVGSSETLRIEYVSSHSVKEYDGDTTPNTIPDRDEQALILLAAWLTAQWIANAAADLQDDSLNADQVDYSSISERWAKRAEDMFRTADRLLSPDKGLGTDASGSAHVKWQSDSLLSGRPRISH